MADVDWNKELDGADGVVAISQVKGIVKARLEGDYQLIFDELFDSDPETPYES